MGDPKQLRALAEAATPGPWSASISRQTQPHAPCVQSSDGVQVCHLRRHYPSEADTDARYIAAISPDVVLALLDRLEAAERERDEWKQASETHLRYLSAWSTWSTEVVYELDGHPKGGQLGHGPSRRCIYEGMRRFKQRAETAEERVRELEEEYQEQRAVALDVHNDWCRLRDENKALRAVAEAARAATRCEEGALSVLHDKLAALDAAKGER